MPTIRNTRAVSRASSFCSVGPTKQDPFSFDSRPRKKKEVIIPEPVAKKFHEPGSLPASIDKPSGVPKKAPIAGKFHEFTTLLTPYLGLRNYDFLVIFCQFFKGL